MCHTPNVICREEESGEARLATGFFNVDCFQDPGFKEVMSGALRYV